MWESVGLCITKAQLTIWYSVHADPDCMHAHTLSLLATCTTYFTIEVFVWCYEASVTCLYASIP